MAITRKDIAASLEYGVRTGFTVGANNYQPIRSPFVREYPSDGASETYADFGSSPWPTQNAGKAGAGGTNSENDAVKVGQITGGQQIQLLGGHERAIQIFNLDWEIAFGITHNAIDDNRVGNLEVWARSAGFRFEQHKDYLAFDALNNGAATTSYGACYDGLSFFNDSHYDPGASYTTTQDNSYAVALGIDNFETVKVAGAKFLDDRGQPIGVDHRLLIVPPDLERIGRNIVQNTETYDTANREMNPYAGNTRLIVSKGSWVDTTAWYLIDDGMEEKPLGMQVRKAPAMTFWDDESAGDGGVRYFKYHARYAVFYGDWRLALQGNT